MKSLRRVALFALAFLVGSQMACSSGVAPKEEIPQTGVSLVALPSSLIVAANRIQVVAHGPDGRRVWSFSLPDNDAIAAAPAAALNSTTYVRGEKALYAISPDGKLTWSARLDSKSSPINAVVALGDSTVAITIGDNQLTGYSHDGQTRWTFTLPDGDRLIAAPVSAPNSEIYVRGTNGLYAVDPNGNLTWHADLQ